MIYCGDCGQPLTEGEMHFHIPDIYLQVWNMKYVLVRTSYIAHTIKTETLPFSIPDNWAEWVFETCGGGINQSGIYRLPGMIWEWALAMSKKNDKASTILKKSINNYLSSRSR